METRGSVGGRLQLEERNAIKNKGQLRRVIPADELAEKYAAAQPSAPPTLESSLVGEKKT